MTDPTTEGVAATRFHPFVPLVPPPSEHHPINAGQSTELGDSGKVAFEKINAGFAHVYAMFKGAVSGGASAGTDALAGLEDRVKAAETKAKGVVTDVSNFVTKAEAVTKDDLVALLATVASHGDILTGLKDDMGKLEALLNRAINAFIDQGTPAVGGAGDPNAPNPPNPSGAG
jgi:Fe-S cluster biogenesis protein NfuA